MIVGIDPDVDKNGVCIMRLQGNSAFYDTMTLKFWELFEKLSDNKNDITKVYIEAGWLHKTQYQRHRKKPQYARIAIARDEGRNGEAGRLIHEMCNYLNIPSKLIIPTSKKIKDRSYFKRLTGIDTSNQEIIDATMLIFGRKS